MPFEIPEDLNENLYGLAWMIGRWEGRGKGTWPGEGEFEFSHQIDIDHNGGPYLFFLSQMFDLDAEGNATRTRTIETGFWRPDGKGNVEVLLCHPEGYSEVWFGSVTGAKIELVTDSVMRTATAEQAYTGGQRLFGQVEGDLMWSFDRATEDVALQPYMWGRLERAQAS